MWGCVRYVGVGWERVGSTIASKSQSHASKYRSTYIHRLHTRYIYRWNIWTSLHRVGARNPEQTPSPHTHRSGGLRQPRTLCSKIPRHTELSTPPAVRRDHVRDNGLYFPGDQEITWAWLLYFTTNLHRYECKCLPCIASYLSLPTIPPPPRCRVVRFPTKTWHCRNPRTTN